MTKGKLGYPWIDARIRALVRKKEKMYHKARRSNDDSLRVATSDSELMSRRRHRMHTGDMFQVS